MKRETMRHPKTYDLMVRLGCSRPTALGYLTLLWDYTGEVAPQGDIGKWPDGVIAQACDWTGDAIEFVEALVEARWLDRVEDPKVRLLIHDWPEHCERFVKAKLEYAHIPFHPLYFNPAPPNGLAKKSTDESPHPTQSLRTVCVEPEQNLLTVKPLSNPIQSNPIQTTRARAREVIHKLSTTPPEKAPAEVACLPARLDDANASEQQQPTADASIPTETNHPLADKVLDWWRDLTFIPAAGRGKFICSTRASPTEKQNLLDEIEAQAQRNGVETLTKSAQADYDGKSEKDRPHSLKYYVVGLWRDLESITGEPCQNCKGEGKVTHKGKVFDPCPVCEGSGKRPKADYKQAKRNGEQPLAALFSSGGGKHGK